MSGPNPFSQSALFQQAVRAIMRPLIRALIAQGVTAPAFYQMVKRTYVEVAAKEMGARATDSGISVATGVHRRDIKTFRAPEAVETASARRRYSVLATVIGQWLADPRRCDDAGTPKPLHRAGALGFDVLVEEISRDIRPRAVLDELVRQGAVRVEGELVHLTREALVGTAETDQKMHFFALNLGDHMSAAVDNLMNDDPPFLERAVFYNTLTDHSVAELEAQARQLGDSALKTLNAAASSLQKADQGQPGATRRFRFGVFFYAADTKPDRDDS